MKGTLGTITQCEASNRKLTMLIPSQSKIDEQKYEASISPMDEAIIAKNSIRAERYLSPFNLGMFLQAFPKADG